MADKQLSADLKSFKDQWAKDLGYKDFKEYQEANKKSYSGDIKQRLSQGAGFGEAFSGGIKEAAGDFRKALSPKDMAKKAYMGIFKGDDILSAYMRGRLAKKAKPKPPTAEESSKQEFLESYDKKLVGRDKSGRFTKLTEDEQWAQQRKYGLTKLTPLSPTPVSGGTGMDGDWSSIAGSVDTIRKAVEALVSFEREGKEQSERDKQARFLKQQDDLEASLEAKNTAPTQITAEVDAPKAKESSGGGLSSIFGFIKNGILKAFKFLFKPSSLLKVLGRVFIIATLVYSLFKGIFAGFEKWKETGSISEALKAFAVTLIDTLTFGIFGEDKIGEVFDKAAMFVARMIDNIVQSFYDMKDWIVNNVGLPVITIPMPKIAQKFGAPESVSVGPYYPFKDNKTSSEEEKSKRPPRVFTEEKEASIKKLKSAKKDTTTPKQLPTEMSLEEKAKGVIGMDVSNMSDEEIEKIIPKGTELGDFERDIDGKLQPLSFTGKTPSPMQGSLQGMVQKFGGDEATAGLQKDSDKLGNFMQGGGLADKFGQMGKGTSNISGSMDSASAAISSKIKAGGVTPEPVSPFGSATSGATISQGSADVEYGQREEMTSPGGNLFNSPKITNNKSSKRDNSTPPADVMNFDFADALMRT